MYLHTCRPVFLISYKENTEPCSSPDLKHVASLEEEEEEEKYLLQTYWEESRGVYTSI